MKEIKLSEQRKKMLEDLSTKNWKLEQQLAEKEKMHLLDETEYQNYCAFKHIESQIKGCLDRERELEKKLAEKEETIKYLKGIKRYDIGEMITENTRLKQQLAEKDKKNKELEQSLHFEEQGHNLSIQYFEEKTDKLRKQIKFESDARKRFKEENQILKYSQNQVAIKELEEIINLFEPYENNEKDTILCANNGISFLEYIKDKIKELKGE